MYGYTKEDIVKLLEGTPKMAGKEAKAHKVKLVTLVGGQKIFAHLKGNCKGEHCCIHNPSNHHMREWPQNWRDDRRIMERICPHGIGHPDPDGLAHDLQHMKPGEGKYAGVHGCDGCCNPENKYRELD